jgi:hypothetical protein
MVESYELGLKLSGKVRPDPQQLSKQKEHYTRAAEIIQPPEDVVRLARDLASGSDKVKLLNLWRRATVLKVKGLNIDDIVSGIREVIEKNKIPRNWAEPMLAKAGYTPSEIKIILDRIYGPGGAGVGAGGIPQGL